MSPIRIALVGLGKIARDQHVPALRSNDDFVIAATASPDGASLEGVPSFASFDEMLASGPAVDAVALCTPPQVRYALALAAIERGLHVLLEKPPAATLSEAEALADRARTQGVTLFAAWHSRFAAGVAPAQEWLKDRPIRRASIIWREDVRVWHPNQDWIWQGGGLGVFDPGINALSILTQILPHAVVLGDATLERPSNRAAPIAARLQMEDVTGVPIDMDLDWRQTGPQTWDIVVETDAGTLRLSKGGAVLDLPGGSRSDEDREYAGIYDRFAALVRAGESDCDVRPLRLVADAFLRGTVTTTDAFYD